ncbi:MAG: hypothetical protein M3552_06365 [Planctomycetota bacterium]|nr:hypothetical protein [Planctomycetaceae bacterium]MDQ3330259.1 hypothetical protein [Planctomycetota bacterium]
MIGLASLLVGASLVGGAPNDVSDDYFAAYREAETRQKLLLVDFGSGAALQGDPADLRRHIVCRISPHYRLEGEDRPLIEHSCFGPLRGEAGLAVVDVTGGPHHGDVVSVLPREHCSPSKVAALLSLPPGTLTQRTLCWAFLVHPERPQSVHAAPSPQLMAHCARHSGRQAAMNDQHHDMSHPGRTEIVAESWPWNKNVVDAAIDIVWSWRQSPGHWGAARQTWSRFGYDMKFNGEKWFATGVFE